MSRMDINSLLNGSSAVHTPDGSTTPSPPTTEIILAPHLRTRVPAKRPAPLAPLSPLDALVQAAADEQRRIDIREGPSTYPNKKRRPSDETPEPSPTYHLHRVPSPTPSPGPSREAEDSFRPQLPVKSESSYPPSAKIESDREPDQYFLPPPVAMDVEPIPEPAITDIGYGSSPTREGNGVNHELSSFTHVPTQSLQEDDADRQSMPPPSTTKSKRGGRGGGAGSRGGAAGSTGRKKVGLIYLCMNS